MKQFALIVTGLLSFQSIALAAVSSAERDALVTLYNSTDGNGHANPAAAARHRYSVMTLLASHGKQLNMSVMLALFRRAFN